MNKELELPPKVGLESYGGDFEQYYEEVYKIFLEDFRNSKPTFMGQDVVLRKKDLKDGKDWNYHKLTHGGEDGSENPVDLIRMERIVWIKHILKYCPCEQIKILPEVRKAGKKKKDKRLMVIYEYDRYIIVLSDRRKYMILWTAYRISNHQLERLLKRYEAHIKTETAKA